MALKLYLVGESYVGKTALQARLSEREWVADGPYTIPIDFRVRSMEVKEIPLRLRIWDTAGYERFRSIRPSYYRGNSVLFLVYSVYNRSSFDSIERWLEEARRSWRGDPETVLVLLGNKVDLDDGTWKERGEEASYGVRLAFGASPPVVDPRSLRITQEEAKEKASRLGIDLSFQVSAKTGAGCEEALLAAVSCFLKRLPPNPIQSGQPQAGFATARGQVGLAPACPPGQTGSRCTVS